MSLDMKKEDRTAEKRHKPDEIVSKLWRVDMLVSQGRSRPPVAVRSIDLTKVTYHLWTALPLQVGIYLICMVSCNHLSGITRWYGAPKWGIPFAQAPLQQVG